MPVALDTRQNLLIEGVRCPFVGDAVGFRFVWEEPADLHPVHRELRLSPEVPQVIQVTWPTAQPPAVSEVLVGLEEGPQLLCCNLLKPIDCQRDVQRLAFELVDKAALNGPSEKGFLVRDLHLEAASRSAHPGKLDTHTEDALTPGMGITVVLLCYGGLKRTEC